MLQSLDKVSAKRRALSCRRENLVPIALTWDAAWKRKLEAFGLGSEMDGCREEVRASLFARNVPTCQRLPRMRTVRFYVRAVFSGVHDEQCVHNGV